MNDEITILWLNAALSCDGESIALTGATQPAIEDLIGGTLPNLPRIEFHHPVLAYENGDEFLEKFYKAANGGIENFILVVEGSIPDDKLSGEGFFAAFGLDEKTGQPIKTCDWIKRLVPNAWAILAVGTCAAYGGVHAMPGNPTGAMGLADFLGWEWKSKAGNPIVCVPGCPTMPDNITQTLLYLVRQFIGVLPPIELDEVLRPTFLFNDTLHEGCDRGGFYEEAKFAENYGAKECIVKLGCWGPVVKCNVGKRGWQNGIGGCANVGGICIGCTMPGFPEKFSPFMNQPPGSLLSSQAISTYGKAINSLRRFTLASMNEEPAWRQKRKN
ncbi:hydrogenase small subunit [soil metagenome]